MHTPQHHIPSGAVTGGSSAARSSSARGRGFEHTAHRLLDDSFRSVQCGHSHSAGDAPPWPSSPAAPEAPAVDAGSAMAGASAEESARGCRSNARERDERARERRTRLPPRPRTALARAASSPAFPSRLRTRVRRALRSLRAARSRRCALTRGKSDRRLHSCVAPRMPNAIPRPRDDHRRSAELFAAAGEIFVRRGADRDFSSRFEETNPRTWLENRGKSESNPAKTRANSLDSTSKRREGAEARKSAGKVSRKYLEVVFFFV